MIAFRLMHLIVTVPITKLVGIIMTHRKMNGYKSSTNPESFYLFPSSYWSQFLSNIVINIEHFFYSVTLCKKSKYFLFYCVNRQDPDYDSCEESSFSDDNSQSDFKEFICLLSPGLKYPSDERV